MGKKNVARASHREAIARSNGHRARKPHPLHSRRVALFTTSSTFALQIFRSRIFKKNSRTTELISNKLTQAQLQMWFVINTWLPSPFIPIPSL